MFDLLNIWKSKDTPVQTENNNKQNNIPDKYYISLDTGTEMLKGLLFSVSDLGIDVLKTFSVPQQLNAMRSGVIMNAETVIENSHLVYDKLVEGIPEQDLPKKVILGMAGELLNGIPLIVEYNREENKDKEITQEEEQQIKDSVYNEIVQKGKKELANRLHTSIDNVSILHVSITGLQIGGNYVDTLVGYNNDKVTLYLYASFAPKKYIHEITRVADSLKMQVACIVTQPFAVARAFKASSESNFSAIFVDIGGGTTDIALVTKGCNIQTKMYAFGGRAFTKRIAENMQLDFRYAEQRKIKYSNGELTPDVKDEVRRILANDSKLWVDTFKIALEELKQSTDVFPSQIYMCGGGSMLPDIKMCLIEYPWTHELNFSEFPRIKLIMPDSLDKVYDKTGTLVNPFDVTPVALARFFWDTLAYPHRHYLSEEFNKEVSVE